MIPKLREALQAIADRVENFTVSIGKADDAVRIGSGDRVYEKELDIDGDALFGDRINEQVGALQDDIRAALQRIDDELSCYLSAARIMEVGALHDEASCERKLEAARAERIRTSAINAVLQGSRNLAGGGDDE